MNANKTIIDALEPLGHPVAFNIYEGEIVDGVTIKLPIYITFNYEDDRAVAFADNKPTIDAAYMQIHLFCPSDFNFFTLKKKIRATLLKVGFTYPGTVSLYEDGTKTNHIIFRCSINGTSETEE